MQDVGILAKTSTSSNIKLQEKVLGIYKPTFYTLIKSLINQQYYSPLKDYAVQVCTSLDTANIIATYSLAQPKYFNNLRFRSLAINTIAVAAATKGQSLEINLAAYISKATNIA